MDRYMKFMALGDLRREFWQPRGCGPNDLLASTQCLPLPYFEYTYIFGYIHTIHGTWRS
jgi:hypothetical protein